MEDFKSALYMAELLYGIELEDTDPLIDIGLVAWNKIGKSNIRLYKLIVDCPNKEVKLPSNCEYIESVTSMYEDWNEVSNTQPNGDFHSLFTESYIENLKHNTSPLYQGGKFINYERVGNTLCLDKDTHGPVQILYKGCELDDEGLPMLNSKQVEAIACYIAYITKFKEGMATHNQVIIQESLLLQQRWAQLCDAARVAEYISQNDMDKILDAKTTFNRKSFNKSFKPIH